MSEGTRVRACRVAEIFDDAASAGLIAEYAAECAIALIGKPAPHRDRYENLEATGFGHCFAAYEDGALCGFAMLICSVVPHYELSCATLESLFVTRRARCGTKLMRVVEDFARKSGCTGIFYAAPVNSRLARLLALRSEVYVKTNEVFCRKLR